MPFEFRDGGVVLGVDDGELSFCEWDFSEGVSKSYAAAGEQERDIDALEA